MSRQPHIPPGCWPALMAAQTAAAYVNERSVETFMRRVGKVYPKPKKIVGRGRVWTKTELDRAIAKLSGEEPVVEDIADLL